MKAAAVLLDDLRAYPQAEAGAGVSFGSNERLENFVSHVAGDAEAGVRDGNPYAGRHAIPIIAGVMRAQEKPASTPHCVKCVAHQVGKYLTQFSGHSGDRSEIIKFSFDGYSR